MPRKAKPEVPEPKPAKPEAGRLVVGGMDIAPMLRAVDAVESRLIAGESVRDICRALRLHSATLYLACARDEEFRGRIDRARELAQDAIVDGIRDMVDDAEPETVGVVKLRVWARIWAAARLRPRKYGDRVVAQVEGPDGGPVTFTWLPVAVASQVTSSSSAPGQAAIDIPGPVQGAIDDGTDKVAGGGPEARKSKKKGISVDLDVSDEKLMSYFGERAPQHKLP